MAKFHYDNLARNLPDCYKKHAEFECPKCREIWASVERKCPKCGTDGVILKDNTSNNFKILEIERLANNDLRLALESIDKILDIENAVGATLDRYGERFNQPRGSATDEQYRILIKAKIIRSLANGSYKSIVDALAFSFSCTIDEILLVETAPMEVSLVKVTLDKINRAGIVDSDAEQLIRKLMPAGVKINISFTGTFEFGKAEGDSDKAKGFGETIDGEIGGYLGWADVSDSRNTLLPI